ncbi:DUF7927 domain-containing protein [Rhodococcus sp. OK302]|uniref:DUF7927 domain-containing protein n=1 Tax=Rhodococcus sp. OK302 TaxID=1882769 RepID=UPI000B9F330B|nr:hypothetical protein [Rhodococcus sp. OK302]OYD61136.1 hypothetical protein BDB13_6081 [Rhodococcus sp. OK302]
MKRSSTVWRTAGLAAAALTIGAAGLLSAAPAGAAPVATQPGELVVNGGGENGKTGWAGAPATQANPLNGHPPSYNGGVNLWWGGAGLAQSKMNQTVNLSPSATLIDAGLVTADMSAYLGGYEEQPDNVGLTYAFKNASGGIIATTVLDPVTNTERGNISGFVHRQKSLKIPVNTRSVLITATFTRVQGTNNDAYADNISLKLETPSPGVLEVTHTSDTSTPVEGGQVVNYTTTFTNTGELPVPVNHVLVLSGVLDDADLVSGPTSGDPALTLTPGAGVDYGVTGSLAPGQTVTITYSVVVKPYANQGDHSLVTQVTAAGSAPTTPPTGCAGTPLCTEVPSADSAAVPLVNPAVALSAGAAVALGAGGFVMVRRRKVVTD